jgi:signal transduction histidine kinase
MRERRHERGRARARAPPVQLVRAPVQLVPRGLRGRAARRYASAVTTHADTQRPGRTSEPGTDHIPLRRAELLMIVGFWTFMALLAAANGILDPRGRGIQSVTFSTPLALAFAESYLWAALTPLVFRLASRFSIEERGDRARRILLLVVAGVVVAVAVEMILGWFRFEVFPSPRRRMMGFNPLFGARHLFWLDDFIVYIAVLAAGFARDFFLRYRARREETARLQAQAARLEAQLAEARLTALRTQINPHFLFNTLHAVSSLVERDPRGVRRMIARLSELLRYTLEGAETQEVPLEQEMAVLARYIEIMQIRFQGRLTVETRLDPAARAALVPNLVLQPLVENAMKHGVSAADGTGHIVVEAALAGDRVRLTVRDDGPGPRAAGGAEGVGLRNTRARLEQLYGEEQRLTLRAGEGGGAVAEIELPFHTGADLHAAGIGG